MVTPRIPHPANFDFGRRVTDDHLHFSSRTVQLRKARWGGKVHRIELVGTQWSPGTCHAALESPTESEITDESGFSLQVTGDGHLIVQDESGKPLLSGHPNGTFGLSGNDWMLRLEGRPGDRYYGLGEKWGPFEKSGQRTIFWNTDVWADFEGAEIAQMRCDPVYASIPYLIIKRATTYIGVLLHTSFPAFASIRSVFEFHRPEEAEPELFLGARGGTPTIYVLVGPTLRELTKGLQRLVGTTPRPPLWALGHHQSRWGYGNLRDLQKLDRAFRKHDIPCDGLWLDIDYMDRFKVFTLDPNFSEGKEDALGRLRARGRHVVPILDPGVKVEPGYSVYETGRKRGVFCSTLEGSPYVGIVWPGPVHFPDFARQEARAFWSEGVEKLARQGFSGFWIDMNDPSTGGSDPEAMRFDAGRLPHAAYRNEYALGMAQATFDGLQVAHPDRRPFVLTRSASPTMSRYAAVWTGDNISSEVHLAASIPTSLNLALSGIPFNGPDVPGFGQDATDDLIVRWYKAGFLFPFLRNHSCQGTRAQEPWAFSKSTLSTVRHYIRLRYKLMPYLYNLFMEQERSGEAILRPLLYDFDSSPELPLDHMADQFLVGPALMQAPVLFSKVKRRNVLIPPGTWFVAATGEWLVGPATLKVRDKRKTTPLFIRGGSVLPMRRRLKGTVPQRLNDIELHVFLPPGKSDARVPFRYEFDAGEGYRYRDGEVSVLVGAFTRRKGTLVLEWSDLTFGAGRCQLSIVAYSGEKKLQIESREFTLREGTWNMVGRKISCRRSATFNVG